MPMINEAILTLHEGVAGVEEIDTVMKLAWRTPWGPFSSPTSLASTFA